jgi:hypothetical protein
MASVAAAASAALATVCTDNLKASGQTAKSSWLGTKSPCPEDDVATVVQIHRNSLFVAVSQQPNKNDVVSSATAKSPSATAKTARNLYE